MDLLLDTCSFIWWDSDERKLSSAAMAAMKDPLNRLRLSIASIWEMQLKHQKGRLKLRKALPEIVQEQCAQNGLLLLPIETGNIYGLGQHGETLLQRSRTLRLSNSASLAGMLRALRCGPKGNALGHKLLEVRLT